MRINYIRECINNRIIQLQFIPSELNVADTLTKPLAINLFSNHTDRILNGFGGDIDNIYQSIADINNINTNIACIEKVCHSVYIREIQSLVNM
jgi:hypothetical protein